MRRMDEEQIRELWLATIPEKLRATRVRKKESRPEKDRRIARQRRQAYALACDPRNEDDAFIVKQYGAGVLIRLIASSDGVPDSVRAMNTHQIKARLEACHRLGRKLASQVLSKEHRD